MLPAAIATAEEAHVVWELPMPPIAYGLIVGAIALVLLVLVWSFRNVAGNVIYGPGGPREGQSRTVAHGAADGHDGHDGAAGPHGSRH